MGGRWWQDYHFWWWINWIQIKRIWIKMICTYVNMYSTSYTLSHNTYFCICFTAVALWAHNLWMHNVFLQELPLFLVSSTFPIKGGSLRVFVSYCFLAFFQHHIAGVWREHLLKVFQKFEKIEADATPSTLCEFSVLGQTIRFASLEMWNMLWCSLMAFCLLPHSFCRQLHTTFSSFSLSFSDSNTRLSP